MSRPQKAPRKLGLVRAIDLAPHLPLRYEDETRITKLRDARVGDVIQIEATACACKVRQYGFRAVAAGLEPYSVFKATLGLRLSQEEEYDGADLSIHKISAPFDLPI